MNYSMSAALSGPAQRQPNPKNKVTHEVNLAAKFANGLCSKEKLFAKHHGD